MISAAPERTVPKRSPVKEPTPVPELWGMTPGLSSKLEALRSTLIFLVVIFHSWKAIENNWLSPEMLATWGVFTTRMLEAIGTMVIPLFFAISGFLFFFNVEYRNDIDLLKKSLAKLGRRLRSLGIPYLAWSVLWTLVFFVLQSIPGSEQYFSNPDKVISNKGAGELLYLVLCNPLPYQFWFIRTAIALFCLSPMLAVALNRVGAWLVVGVGLVWLVGSPIGFTLGEYSLLPGSATFSFVLGAYLGLQRPFVSLQLPGTRWLWVPLLLCISAIAVVPDIYQRIDPAHMLLASLGMLTVWYNYELCRDVLESDAAKWLGGSAFFVFAMHEPLLMIPTKLGGPFLSSHPIGILAGAFVVPVITIVGCVAVAKALKRHCRPAYTILNGGR